jgi:hypothetical protein
VAQAGPGVVELQQQLADRGVLKVPQRTQFIELEQFNCRFTSHDGDAASLKVYDA